MPSFRGIQLSLLCATLALSAPASAQDGVLRGSVVGAEDGRGIPAARVQAVSDAGQPAAAALSDESGAFVLRLAAGSYRVSVVRIGFERRDIQGVVVRAGAETPLSITMRAAAAALSRVVVSASRAPEKVLDAPASVSVVDLRTIEERPNLSVADHLRATPGVDVSTGGLVQSNIVARGFNNAFSGTLLTLQDNRFAGVPSLRVNVPYLFTATNEDIERLEVVLGPGAALYGPNAANGVLHVITKSPFDSKGTLLTLSGGERSTLRTSVRHAGTVGSRLGFKLSGEYLTGNDWQYRDPAEPDSIPRPTGPGTRAMRDNARDFDVRRYAGEARMDYRHSDRTEVITSYGYSRAGSAIELTGANGAAQIRDWTFQHLQTRLRSGKLFAQAFVNLSDAGNKDSLDTRGTFLLRTGTPIVDQSRVAAAQLQHGFDLGTRQSFIYGADYIFTNPRTGNTINGRNEDEDNVTEVGAYVHSVTRLSPRVEFIAALRGDNHSYLREFFVSPRAALVFKPSDTQNLRFTFNQAFTTPPNFQFFLDLPQGRLGPLPFVVRAVGVPQGGYQFRRECAGGLDMLCMHSPFTPPAGGGGSASVAANAAAYFQAAVTVASGSLPPSLVSLLRTLNPTSANVATRLQTLGFGPRGPAFSPSAPQDVKDVEPLTAGFSDVYEIGYKEIRGRVSYSLDGWYQRRKNFVAPASNASPNVFLETPSLQAYLTAALTPYMGAAAAAATSAQISPALSGIPLGTVTPSSSRTNSPDLVFTYRNIKETIELYGADFGMDVRVTDRFTLAGTYSWLSDDEFAKIPNGAQPLALNAATHKASLTGKFRDEASGIGAELRGRYVNAFPVNSGVYVGHVPVNALVDAGFSYRLPFGARNATWSVSATNILDNERATFVGVPQIGRLVMTQLQYRF